MCVVLIYHFLSPLKYFTTQIKKELKRTKENSWNKTSLETGKKEKYLIAQTKEKQIKYTKWKYIYTFFFKVPPV